MRLGPGSGPSTLRLLAAVAAVVVGHVAILVSGYPVVAAMLFAPWVGIPAALLVIALLIAATAAALRIVTDRWRFGAATVSGLATCTVYLLLLMRAGEIPIAWLPALSLDLGAVAAGVAGGLMAAVLLPSWPFRAVGAVAALATVGYFIQPSIAERAVQQEAEREASEQAWENFLRVMTRPVISDVDGARVAHAGAGEYITTLWMTTAEGGVMEVQTVPDSPNTGREKLPCWLMVHDVGMLDDTVTMEQYDGICSSDGHGRWEMADGRAIAVTFEDRLVIVRTPELEFASDYGSRDASRAELEDAVRHLRLLSLDEFRQLIVETAPDPV